MDDQLSGLLDSDVSQRLKRCIPGEPEADSSDVLKILQYIPAPDLPEIPSWEQGLKIAFYIPPIFVDVVGNSLVILIVALNKKMRTTTNLLILNLSVSDIMVACFCMWIHLATQLQPGNLWPFGAFLCKVTSFVQGKCYSNSCSLKENRRKPSLMIIKISQRTFSMFNPLTNPLGARGYLTELCPYFSTFSSCLSFSFHFLIYFIRPLLSKWAH